MKKLLCMLMLLLTLLCVFAACDEAKSTPCTDGHTIGEWTVKLEASETQSGIRQKSCTVCNAIMEVELIPATVSNKNSCVNGHTPGEWQMITIPTEEERVEVEWKRYCTQCNTLVESTNSNPNGLDKLSDWLDYGGETINVLYWNDCETPEFEQKEITGDNVRDAIYNRNTNIKNRLNVKLNWIGAAGNALNRELFVKQVATDFTSGAQSYDIITSYSRTQGMLAMQGLLCDLSDIQNSYIDFEKPWWPQSIVSDMSMGINNYYFLTGDISSNAMQMMKVIFCNKTLFEQYELELPYQEVYNGTWTVDKLIALTNRMNTYNYGFVGQARHTSALYTAAGLHKMEKSEANQFLWICEDFCSEKTVDLMKKLVAWAATDSVVIDENNWNMSTARATFESGHALMWAACVINSSVLKDSNFDYGILPMPKYDSAQCHYYTELLNPYSLYGVYAGFDTCEGAQETLTMFSAVLECWASESYRLVTPEIFEVTIQQKYAEAQEETDMWEYIRSGVRLDLGQIFNDELADIDNALGNTILNGEDWETVGATYRADVQTALSDLWRKYHTQ